ncbi:MAG: type II toxin-antitoxin system prevent-host-death family antitoxin [Trueperaceae bacterium]
MSKTLPVTLTASEARAAFSDLLDRVEQGEVIIARHGKPVATVINTERYQALLETLEALEEELLAERAHARLARIEAGLERTQSFDEGLR